MPLSFTVIDFETANGSRSSAVSVGAVKVQDGKIVDRFSTLIKPPVGHDDFHPGNVRIHGIRSRDVVNAPEWPEVSTDLAPFIGGDILVAHNVGFDSSVLRSMCQTYGMTVPALETYCTLALSKATLELSSYKLSAVADSLGLGAFQHHDALEDSLASARILLRIAELTGSASFADLRRAQRRPRIRPADLPGQHRIDAPLVADAPASDVLAAVAPTLEGESVVFTGELDVLNRTAAKALLLAHGGKFQSTPTKATTLVVVGDFDRAGLADGATYGSKVEKAFTLVRKGSSVRIITEKEFLDRLALTRHEVVDWLLSSGLGRSGGAFIPGGSGIFEPHLPDYFVNQAREALDADLGAWEWFERSLSHPDGPAAPGDVCVWCSRPVPDNAHRHAKSRRVCSLACSRSMQWTVVRMWELNNLTHPDRRALVWI